MTVVADSGPLIALAKIDSLSILFDLFPQIITPEAVYEETVRQGQRVRASDSILLQSAYDAGQLRIEPLPEPLPADTLRLGQGERESIHLALHKQATWLLVDDFDARQAAMSLFEAARSPIRIKGTLGVITSAYVEGVVSMDNAIQRLDALRTREDIWISIELCRQVEQSLRRLSSEK